MMDMPQGSDENTNDPKACVRSERPDDSPDSWSNDEWEESDRQCDDCKKLAWEAHWYDDPPSQGGACIGMKYECGDCGWVDSA